MSIDNKVQQLFSAIQEKVSIHFYLSPMVLTIADSNGTFDGYYGFYSSGAVRVETNGDSIIGVSVWNAPHDLNNPSYRIRISSGDALQEVELIAAVINGRGGALTRNSTFIESTREDIGQFMDSLGLYAYNKRLQSLYLAYEQWCHVKGKKLVSLNYFIAMAREWMVIKGKGSYAGIEVVPGSQESTQVNGASEEEFEADIINNSAYYKAALVEHTIERMVRRDPLINSLFLAGSAGMGKSYTVLETLKKFPDVSDNIIYKKGNIRGATGLLQLLWDNRKNKILVLDDCDNLLADKDRNFPALSYLKAALETQQSGRLISYIRASNVGAKSVKENEAKGLKAWFRNSKVLDANGDPLICYHASSSPNFSQFKLGNDIGIHFGTISQANDKASDKAGIYPVYLRIENPVYAKDAIDHTDASSVLNGFGEVVGQPGALSSEQWKDLVLSFDESGDDSVEYIRNWLIRKGFDGIIYDNEVEGAGKSYCVFSPNQIKSIYNRGVFDLESDNILEGTSWFDSGKYPKAVSKEAKDEIKSVHSWFDATPAKEPAKEPEEDNTKVPDEFMFESKMIFISNLEEIPESIGDRVFAIQMNYTKDQAIELIDSKLETLCPEYPQLTLEDKQVILEFIKKHKDSAAKISFRTFIHIAAIYVSQDPLWEKWALIELQKRL